MATNCPKRSTAALYTRAICTAILEAARLLGKGEGRPIPRRRLVNFLRGCQLPPTKLAKEETFGLLESHSARALEGVIESLIEAGHLLLESSHGSSGIAVHGSREAGAAAAAPSRFEDVRIPRGTRLGSHPLLEERLRSLRQRIAGEDGRSAYTIFPNATLAELAARRPRSLAELAEISGLGELRIRKYGRRILAALR